jgi:hypothetical protein
MRRAAIAETAAHLQYLAGRGEAEMSADLAAAQYARAAPQPAGPAPAG